MTVFANIRTYTYTAKQITQIGVFCPPVMLRVLPTKQYVCRIPKHQISFEMLSRLVNIFRRKSDLISVPDSRLK